MKLNIQAKRSLLFLLAILFLISAACSLQKPLTAEQIYEKTREKIEHLKTAHIKMDVVQESQGSEVTMSGEGDIEIPNKIHLVMETNGEKIEVLMLSETEGYGRVVGDKLWMYIPVDAASQYTLGPGSMGTMQLPEEVTNLQKIEDESIDGVDCYHLTLSISQDRYFEKVTPAPAPGILNSLNQPVNVDVWVSRRDMLVRKMVLVVNMEIGGAEMKNTITLSYSNLNEPVTIDRPADEEISP